MISYAIVPLIATIAYIPLLVTTVNSRPWQRRHTLFILFLIPALLWSLFDYFLRTNYYPEHVLTLGKIIMATASLMFIQFHLFNTSFYPPGKGKWLPFAYISLAVILMMIVLGFLPESISIINGQVRPNYGPGMIVYIVLILVLTSRDFYVLFRRLKDVENPALYNQIVALILGLSVLISLAMFGMIPFMREFPTIHLGNLVNAIILSYAVVRHRLVDIRIVLRQGSTLLLLGIIGIVTYLLLLVVFHGIFDFNLDLRAAFFAILIAILVAVIIYRVRGVLFLGISRVFQGESYEYRQKLSDFADRIQNVFSLKEQGGELLALVTKAIGCKRVGLLFPVAGSEDFAAQFVEPKRNNPLASLELREHNPVVEYVRRERKPLTREDLAILPELRGLWEQEKEEIKSNEIELFMPLISRDRLIAILALGKKQSGRYLLEDINLLEDVTDRVAVSMEKEYLREQLREREEELSVLNRSSAIITSSLDIQEIYDNFIEELKKIVDVSWAAIVLIEGNGAYFLALSSDIGSAWQVGERIPIKGTATEWVATNKKTMFEPDLLQESRFVTAEYHIKQGVRSIVYLPLIAKGEAIGSLIVASRHPNAYSQRHIKLLEQIASQVAMPVENAQLYAKAEEKARIDELTGLLNRRSLDEMLASEIGRHSRYGGVFSLIILDLDSFKAFNDNYGHLAGDKLLRQVGSIIKGAIRGADQAFRHGGDEFAVLLPQTAIDAANYVSERVRRHVALKAKAGNIRITASLGVATWPADGIGPNEIIAAADAALYHAKRSGGNRSHCASGTLLPLGDTEVTVQSDDDSGALSAIYALSAAVDTRDHYTRTHSKKVTDYTLALGEALNLEPLELNRLETCALLHDIGKIGISEEILNKPGKLTAEEWEIAKTHPQLGAAIAGRVHQLAPCVAGIMHHHERYDGGGYPKGLKGEDIPLEARILGIADAFAAMTSERAYSGALSQKRALAEIKQGAGKQFDPHLVKVFLSIVKTTALLPEEKK